ncbi:hypothetical protein JXA80_04295 [bacterium]|nr:hypothetical protein [candidate division CSSED10-310 bacterium]
MLQVRNETPGFKSSRKTSYDYSSRIFYPTEGHPQYKNLPKNHPDPDDEEAMAYYNAQRERDRHQNQNKNQNQSQNQSQNQNQGSGDQRGSKNRRNKPFQRRPRSDDQGPSSERDHRHREREPRETMRENALDVVVKTPLPVRVEPVGDPVKESTDERESRGVREHRPSSRSRKPRPPKSKLQIDTASVSHDDEATDKMLREEDYTGTALTSDRSAATILSDAKRDSSHTSQGLVHSDYETGSNIAPKEQDNRSS